MGTNCQNCEMMAKYKYWKELPAVKHSFLKRISGRSFHNEMVLPQEFKHCLKSGWCILQGPSGNVWKVKVKQTDEIIFFRDGWANFVNDHDLRIGDSCVFSYSGDSSFDVLIFNQSGSECEGAFFTQNSSSFPSRIPCLSSLHSHLSSFYNDIHPKHEDEDEEDDESYEDEDDSDGVVSHKKRGLKRGRPAACRGTKQYQTVHVSRRREVTPEEIKAASNEATMHVIRNKSYLPMIQITMLKTHVYRGFHMTIKKKWALDHMCLEDHEVKLRVPGVQGSWVIGCRWTKLPQCQLRGKWPDFVFDNNLEEHDVCVFELVRQANPKSRKKAIMNVHIFRVVDDTVPLKVVRKT